MYSDWAMLLLFGAVFIWLGALSYFLLGVIGNKSSSRRAGRVIDSSSGIMHRIALLRYNPYGDTGGDQSFSLALVDGEGSGVVITSLHSRASTRVFAKPVILGKPDKYQLSKEEEEVIK